MNWPEESLDPSNSERLPCSCWASWKLHSTAISVLGSSVGVVIIGVDVIGFFMSSFFLLLFFLAKMVMKRMMMMLNTLRTTVATTDNGHSCSAGPGFFELSTETFPHVISVSASPLVTIFWHFVLQGLHLWWIWSLKVPSGHGLQERFSVGSWPLSHFLTQKEHLASPQVSPSLQPHCVSVVAVHSFTMTWAPTHCEHLWHWRSVGFSMYFPASQGVQSPFSSGPHPVIRRCPKDKGQGKGLIYWSFYNDWFKNKM